MIVKMVVLFTKMVKMVVLALKIVNMIVTLLKIVKMVVSPLAIVSPLMRRGWGLSSSSEVMEEEDGSISLTPESAGLGGWEPASHKIVFTCTLML